MLFEILLERNRLEHEILHISENERRRISHDLHDGLCQQLSGAVIRCSVLEEKLAGDERYHTEVAQLSSLLEESVDHAYDLSRGLWPVEQDSYGLGHSLEELTRRLAGSSGIKITFTQKRSCEECAFAGATQLFTGATSVKFGSTSASGVSGVTYTRITAVSPAGVSGQIADITVITPGGTSATSSADQFTYTQNQARNQTTGAVYALLADARNAATSIGRLFCFHDS